MIHKLVIPGWHPCRLNELIGVHWATRVKLKRGDLDLVAAYAKMQSIPPATGRRRVSLRLTLAPRQRAGDPDAYWKSTLDALAASKLLVDDSRTWCELGEITFERGSERKTVIELEDIQ